MRETITLLIYHHRPAPPAHSTNSTMVNTISRERARERGGILRSTIILIPIGKDSMQTSPSLAIVLHRRAIHSVAVDAVRRRRLGHRPCHRYRHHINNRTHSSLIRLRFLTPSWQKCRRCSGGLRRRHHRRQAGSLLGQKTLLLSGGDRRPEEPRRL